MAATKKTTKAEEAEVKTEAPVVVTEETTTEKPTKKVAKKAAAEIVEEVAEVTETTEDKKTAKAGKRSDKALKEAEEKAEKEERKAAGDTTPKDGEAKVAKKQNPTRSRLERRGKNYRKAAETLEAGKVYSLKEAVALAAQTSVGKFDGT